jgi:hypothetical protein
MTRQQLDHVNTLQKFLSPSLSLERILKFQRFVLMVVTFPAFAKNKTKVRLFL